MDYDTVCFDLDGTLWDVIACTCSAWNRVSERLGLRETPITEDDLRGTTGKPIHDCVSALFAAFAGPVDELVLEIEEEEAGSLTAAGVHLYPGVVSGIEALVGHYRICLVSNCQAWYMDRFFELCGMRHHFDAVDCHGLSGVSKAEMITRIRRNDADRLLYVGDTEGDWQGARGAGVDFCHAAYGFGSAPDSEHRIERFADLLRVLGIPDPIEA